MSRGQYSIEALIAAAALLAAIALFVGAVNQNDFTAATADALKANAASADCVVLEALSAQKRAATEYDFSSQANATGRCLATARAAGNYEVQSSLEKR
ncbi:hypothetical protein COX86_01895 [Candidatus Micrarchaeota archaeon CG_4_10_14_0_2_um_filter_60_11]|nr:MAG: hypothetical protein AUJ16_03270 [Candidatus Micrarchaeota archaeon CG1_02_60_51]PIN96240.1 MAG: hypothetical protein COU39_02115 [Candidatus Micrarchaeota archaeon CG10_big_fil_rev_8_21_14_0_10_60_32]PIO02273.1 MAG: hypothetical protein COT58_01010 [Candidatus Micrarchaeota archaeon CG09_land_8_20_14_0_10_60_16]PIY91566.1 MAG: hypothetical protein COY71_02470 [Candidatus Micrarchaeota archaeon CG_4_10_14_0_8_um_filter_60_7]PIZ91022.1 MAG: hypothetical protein COX86_01895 [Candidatus Mi